MHVMTWRAISISPHLQRVRHVIGCHLSQDTRFNMLVMTCGALYISPHLGRVLQRHAVHDDPSGRVFENKHSTDIGV